ncbi:hypothetical protein [Arthrobacter gengyunqii]|uniref:PH domain-containing protein n=1 Tax=Arthrobacter gengyunqii TaxID=2886940 RepID=A0ABS8GH12_9MICC|nr:hypothetical protein [Arthrobacter gengyunqii]MCC3265136.1 hypothetical protein [Arthrobacter gengyunqii]
MTLAIAALAWWARKFPNRAKDYPERVRMPKFIAFIGWLFVVVGLLIGIWAFTWPEGPLDARIASAAILAAGIGFIAMYRNFYMVTGPYQVVFRSVLGKEQVIHYREIVHYSVYRLRGQQFVDVRSVHGVKLSMNTTAYDLRPLLRAIDYREATGRWPVPVDAPISESPSATDLR